MLLPPALTHCSLPLRAPSAERTDTLKAQRTHTHIHRHTHPTSREIRKCARSKPLYYTFSLRLINNSSVAVPPSLSSSSSSSTLLLLPSLPPSLPLTTITCHEAKVGKRKKNPIIFILVAGVWVDGDVLPLKETGNEKKKRNKIERRKRWTRGKKIRQLFVRMCVCAAQRAIYTDTHT